MKPSILRPVQVAEVPPLWVAYRWSGSDRSAMDIANAITIGRTQAVNVIVSFPRNASGECIEPRRQLEVTQLVDDGTAIRLDPGDWLMRPTTRSHGDWPAPWVRTARTVFDAAYTVVGDNQEDETP